MKVMSRYPSELIIPGNFPIMKWTESLVQVAAAWPGRPSEFYLGRWKSRVWLYNLDRTVMCTKSAPLGAEASAAFVKKFCGPNTHEPIQTGVQRKHFD